MAEEDDSDDSQKTEEPTERRLAEAFRKGKVIYSREITNFLMILSITLIISWLSTPMMHDTTVFLSYYIEHAYQLPLNEGNLGRILSNTIWNSIAIIIIPLLITMLASLISSFLQNGKITFSAETIMPDFKRISLIKGLGRLFSSHSVIELFKAVIRMVLIAVALYFTIEPSIKHLAGLYDYSIADILGFTLDLAIKMMITVCVIMALLAALDYLYQRYQFYKNLRMTKYEVKQEYRESEGNPEVKAKIRAIRNERARKRMMAAVPSADVVITNPTHFSVALKYETGKMRAPKLIAKGQDLVALRIREIAKEHGIHIVENPPLARALYSSVNLDEEIPVEHYKAVAEIISYVYKLKGK
jgi:flagellar biosynthetic protein FlhB